jgi:hypothetical protein
MRPEQFEHFLRHVYKGGGQLGEGTIRSRVSNCSTVEVHEGNLDALFSQDRLTDLVSRLNYTTADEQAGRPLRHRVPISGDWRNGCATLKAAVALYLAFCEHQERLAPQQPLPPPKEPPVPLKQLAWPSWSQPRAEETLALARVVARYARFLRPEIVRAIADDNESNRAAWCEALRLRGIDPTAYLWPGSACAFPGVRRHAGSDEIAIFRKRVQGTFRNALALDDNDYPKQVWSFTLIGRKFSKHGPYGYALAHLADHKVHKNKAETDFRIVEGQDETTLHGLYTSPTNTAYLPVATIKPTDFDPLLRNLLKRRAAALYGSFCEPLPPWLSIRPAPNSDWELDRFEWPEPVGDPALIPAFLSFRRDKLAELFTSRPVVPGS